MNRDEWQYSSSCLRQLLNKLAEGDFQKRVKYRFGLQFNPMFGFYHLWDGLGYDLEHGEPSTVATIKLRPKTATLRYYPEYIFKEQLLKFKLPDRQTVFIESDNVSRHDSWAHNRIHANVERRVRERRDFLERENRERPPHSVLMEITLSNMEAAYSGLQMTSSSTVTPFTHTTLLTVVFNSQEHLENNRAIAQEMLHRIMRLGTRLDEHRTWTFDEIESIHRTSEAQHEEHRRLEEEYVRQRTAGLQARQNAFYDVNRQTFYGRPMEQIQEYMNVTGTAVNEANLQNAVRHMDELNIPRESMWDSEAIRRLTNDV